MRVEQTRASGRLIKLDGLRGAAFVLVTLSHAGLLPLGKVGVGIFFSLSGLLITGILLDLRQTIRCPRSFLRVLLVFYIRRALRLMPLLYTVLSVSWLISLPPIRESGWWHFLHLSNIWQYQNRWDGYGSNLWTLSIEEQFYIVWPWLVLLLPARPLVWVTFLFLFIAPFTRWALLLAHQGFGVVGTRIGDPNLLPVCQLDCLGGGALLAQGQRTLGA